MTAVMEKLIEATRKLPASDQDQYAARWLAELEDDRKWDESFAESQDVLERMANEALAEHRAGSTKPLFPDGDE